MLPPSKEHPCSACGYPEVDPELKELLSWAKSLKRRRRG